MPIARRAITAATVFLLLTVTLMPLNSLAGDIEVDLSRVRRSGLKQGLLNGLNHYYGPNAASNAADALISALMPTSWRFSGIRGYGYGADIYRFVVEDYYYDKRFGTSTVLNLQDIFNAKHGKPISIRASCLPEESGCFPSFENLRQAWYTAIRDFLIATNGTRIAFFDLLAEPDATFTNVSADELYELMKIGYFLVKELRPDTKTVGPSLISFKQGLLDSLLAHMARDGIHLDAISWHELGNNPEITGTHVAIFQSLLQKYPAVCKPSCPEVHINEYQGENTTFIPGSAVGWLTHLESANVRQANRACWGGDAGSPIPYQSCWYGFSGLLTPDSSTPQPIYYVYKFYAELNASRFSTKSTIPRIAVISGETRKGQIGLLAGNYGPTNEAGQIRLINFTKSSAKVDIYRLDNTSNQVVRLPTVNGVTFFASPKKSVLTLQLEFPIGSAYWIVVTPSPY